MSRVFFLEELETIATYWRILRKDGVALGFTSHNKDLRFDGLVHRAAPGMLPSAIRRTAELTPDSVEVQGMLTHDAISVSDLRLGRYDGARIAIGVVDWQSLEFSSLFHGEIGSVRAEANRFEADLLSAKAQLEFDTVPRTSPTCRADFCDKRCQLSPAPFTHLCQLTSFNPDTATLLFSGAPPAESMLHGSVRWLDGPFAGLSSAVLDSGPEGLVVDWQLENTLQAGFRAFLREGCDHTIGTCNVRFGNSINFQGEPFLPGNDLLTRYPVSST